MSILEFGLIYIFSGFVFLDRIARDSVYVQSPRPGIETYIGLMFNLYTVVFEFVSFSFIMKYNLIHIKSCIFLLWLSVTFFYNCSIKHVIVKKISSKSRITIQNCPKDARGIYSLGYRRFIFWTERRLKYQIIVIFWRKKIIVDNLLDLVRVKPHLPIKSRNADSILYFFQIKFFHQNISLAKLAYLFQTFKPLTYCGP